MSVRKKRIIIADDSQAFIMYFAVVLKRLGFSVVPAQNGLEVMKLVRLAEPDLIALDAYMSQMDGMTTLRLLKDDERTAHIPVVMVSSSRDRSLVEQATKMGACGFLEKPLDLDRVNSVIQQALYAPPQCRGSLRADVSMKVLLTHDDSDYVLYAESLSPEGMYIRKKDPLPVGSEVRVKMELGSGTLDIGGTVVYVKGLFGGELKVSPGLAVKFAGASPQQQALLNEYVKRALSGDILEEQ